MELAKKLSAYNRSKMARMGSCGATLKGGKRRGGKKTRKLSPGAAAWKNHVMKTFREMRAKDRSATFKSAMKTAAKSYRK